MDRDGLSIVVPNWNHEAFLPRSVTSGLRGVEAMRDAGVPAELIVVDDQSRDGSTALLRQLEALYHGRGLRVLAMAKNGGLPSARNRGLAEASYRAVAFMDADNELVPENLPTLHRALVETGAAAAFGNLLVRDLGAPAARHVYSNTGVRRSIFAGNYIDAFSVVDRVQLVDAGRYDPALTTHEDYDLWMHLATTGRRMVFVPVVLGYYDVVPNSMVKDIEQYHRVVTRLKRVYDQVGARPLLPIETECLRYHPDLGYL